VSQRPTESLIRELARDLQAVRPIPRLRVVAAGLVAVWALAAAVHWLFGGPLPLVGKGSFWGDPAFLAVFVGLGFAAVGALLTAFASAVPGREAVARTSGQLALLGVALALGGGLWALAAAANGAPETPLAQHLSCAGRACALGIVPAVFACAFLARASTRRPVVAAGIAACGAVGLGAIAVHSSCSAGGGVHWLLGHALGPIAAAPLLAFPLAAVASRWSKRGGKRS
jgi:hypothetical protein